MKIWHTGACAEQVKYVERRAISSRAHGNGYTRHAWGGMLSQKMFTFREVNICCWWKIMKLYFLECAPGVTRKHKFKLMYFFLLKACVCWQEDSSSSSSFNHRKLKIFQQQARQPLMTKTCGFNVHNTRRQHENEELNAFSNRSKGKSHTISYTYTRKKLF